MMRWSPTGTLSPLSLPPWPTPDWDRTLKVASRKFHYYGLRLLCGVQSQPLGPMGGPVSGLL